MSDILREAREVLEGVTSGPWTICRLADQTPHSIQSSYGCINGLSAMFTLAHINVPDESAVGMTDGAFCPETADANARFIAWAREGAPALIARAEAAEAALERDRSFVADTINGVHFAIRSREWLLEGRGCYEWDDDRYRAEFGQALEAIHDPINKLRAIAADWSNCPTDPAKIKAARADAAEIAKLQVRAEAAEAALARAYMAGRDDAATVAYRACAETRHVTLGKKAEESILAIPVPADLAKRVGGSHE